MNGEREIKTEDKNIEKGEGRKRVKRGGKGKEEEGRKRQESTFPLQYQDNIIIQFSEMTFSVLWPQNLSDSMVFPRMFALYSWEMITSESQVPVLCLYICILSNK